MSKIKINEYWKNNLHCPSNMYRAKYDADNMINIIAIKNFLLYSNLSTTKYKIIDITTIPILP